MTKEHIIFISAYYTCCILLLGLIKIIFSLYSIEIFSYFLLFYLEGFLLGIVLFPLLRMLLKSVYTRNTAMIVDGIVLVVLLNLVSLIFDQQSLTLNLIKNIGTNGFSLYDNIVIVHLISMFAFIITVLLECRKKSGGLYQSIQNPTV